MNGRLVMPMTLKRKCLTIFLILLTLYTVIGFFLIPVLIRHFGEKALKEHINEASVIERVGFNPFTWSLRVEGLSTADVEGAWSAKWASAEVNVSSLTVLKLYPVFDRIALDGSNISVMREPSLNDVEVASTESGAPTEGWRTLLARLNESEIPKLRIDLLEVTNGQISFTDHTNSTEYSQVIDPINFSLRDLSTVSDGSTRMQFLAETKTGATLQWQGTLTTQPLRSEGSFRLAGLEVDHLSPYYTELIRFQLNSAVFGFGFDYSLDLSDLKNVFLMSNGSLSLRDVLCSPMDDENTLLSIEDVSLEGIGFHFPTMVLDVDRVGISNGETLVRRDRDGTINLQRLVVAKVVAEREEESPAIVSEDALEPLSYTVKLIEVANYTLRWEEDLEQGLANVDVDVASIQVEGISSDVASPVQIDAEYRIGETGIIQLSGSVIAQDATLDLELSVKQLPLTIAAAYSNEFAQMGIDSGDFNFEGKLLNDTGAGLRATGQASIIGFSAKHGPGAGTIIQWDALELDGLDFVASPFELDLAAIKLTKPVVAMQRQPSVAEKVTSEASDEEVVATGESVSAPLNVAIDVIEIEAGSFTFVDAAIEPSATFVINELGVSLKDLDLAEPLPATLELNALVNDSPFSVSGKLKPGDLQSTTTLKISLQNLALPQLSPYSGQAVGRRIAKGKFSLESDWSIEASQLKASNKIVINQLEFGDVIESETAMSLPLDLAVILLSGPSGVMDLSLPLAGDLSDPKASLGQIIRTAVVGLITNVAAAPFKLLSGLVDSGEDLSVIEFANGESTLSDAMFDRLNAIAGALKERPELQLQVIPEITEADRIRLKKDQLRTQLLEGSTSQDDQTYRKLLVERYQQVVATADTPVQEMLPDDPEGYLKMEATFLAEVVLPEAFVQTLAKQRADAVSQHLQSAHGLEATRLELVEFEAVDSGEGLRFDLK